MFLIVLITIFSFSFNSHALNCDTVGEVPKVIKTFDPTYGRCITGYQDFYNFDIETVDQFCDCQEKTVPKMEDKKLFTLADKAYPLILDDILNFRNYILFTKNLPKGTRPNLGQSCNLTTILNSSGCLEGKGRVNFLEAFGELLHDKSFHSSSESAEQRIVDVFVDKIMYESENTVPNNTLKNVMVCAPVSVQSTFFSQPVEVGSDISISEIIKNFGVSEELPIVTALNRFVKGEMNKSDFAKSTQNEMDRQCGLIKNQFDNLCSDNSIFDDKVLNNDEINTIKLDELSLDSDEQIYESLVLGTAICENRKSKGENIYDYSSKVLGKNFRDVRRKAQSYKEYFNGQYYREKNERVCEAVCVEPKGPYPVEGCKKKDKDVVLKEMGCSVSMDLSTDLAKRCEYISSIYSADIKKEIKEIGERIAKVESGEAYIDENGEYVEKSSSSDGVAGAKSMLSEFLGVGRRLNEVDPKPAVALEGPEANEVASLEMKDTTSPTVNTKSSDVKSNPSIEYVNKSAVAQTDNRMGNINEPKVTQLNSGNQLSGINTSVSRDTPKAQKVDTSLNTHLDSLKQKLARINRERDEYKKIVNSKKTNANSSDDVFAGASLSSLNDSFSLGSPAAVGSSFNANIAPAGSNNFFNGRNNDTVASNTVDYNYQGPKRATNITGEQGLTDQVGGAQRAVAQGDGTENDSPQSVGLRNAISEVGGSPLAAGNLVTKSSDSSLAPIARLFNNEISKAEVKVASGGGEKVVIIDDDQIKATEINLVYLLRDRDDIQPGVDVIHIQYINPDNQTVSVKLIPTKFDKNFTGYTIDENASERWLSALLKAKANLIR